MSGHERDRDLREAFRALREGEQARAPAFSDLATSHDRQPTRRGWWF